MINHPNLNESLAVLKSVLGSRVVSYQPVFAKALRSVPAALMVSYVLFLESKVSDVAAIEIDGLLFFPVSGAEWYDVTGLTKEQQMTARGLLRGTGFWFEKQVGMQRKLHYGVDLKAIVGFINQIPQPQNSDQ